MLSTPSTPASSSPPSPYLPQHVTVPLFRDYDSPKELDSPSLPSFPADRKLQQPSLRWRPSSRLALPFTVLFLAATSLVLLASNFVTSPSPAGTYYDSLYEILSSSPSPERIRRWFSQPSERPLQKEGIVVVEAKADHTVTALCLHGLGGHGADWPFYQTLSKRYPFVRWVSPTAEYKDVTVRNGERVRAWFDISTFDDLYQDEDIKGYAHSAQQINQLVEQERALLISQGKEPRIVMMGFSQGGVMTLLSTLLSQDPSRFEAAVVFSTYLPMIDNIASLIHPAARDLPLLWAHGRADSYLTYAHAQEGVELLRSDKVGMKNVDFRGYDGLQHAWAHHELSDLGDWFGRHIPFYRTHPSSSSSSPSAAAAPFLAYVGASVDHSFPFTEDERKEMKATEDEPVTAGKARMEERAVEDEDAKVEAEPTARKVRMSKRHGQWDRGVRRLHSTKLSV